MVRRGQARVFSLLLNLWTNPITPVLHSHTCVAGVLSRWSGFVSKWHAGQCAVLAAALRSRLCFGGTIISEQLAKEATGGGGKTVAYFCV